VSEIIKSNDYDEKDFFKEQINDCVETINKQLERLTKILEEKKKELDFTYKIEIKYSSVFEYWKCNLELEHIEKIDF
jgi:hypothetical protein